MDFNFKMQIRKGYVGGFMSIYIAIFGLFDGIHECSARCRTSLKYEIYVCPINNEMIHMKGVNSGMFVNMDETVWYFDCHHNCTVNEKGAKTVSVRNGSSANKRCMLCVTVATDRTKLPTFVKIKGATNGFIAKLLRRLCQKECMVGHKRKAGCTIKWCSFGNRKHESLV